MSRYFVVVTLDAVQSASWTSYYGVDRAASLNTSPFLALRVPATDLEHGYASDPDRISCLFPISTQKPLAPNEGYYFSLSEQTSVPADDQRILVVTPSLSQNDLPLYIHTYAMLEERPMSPVTVRLHTDAGKEYEIGEASYKAFCRAALDDCKKQIYFERNTNKRTGGDDVAGDDWKTWSRRPGLEYSNRPSWLVFDHLQFEVFSCSEPLNLYKELLLYEQYVTALFFRFNLN